MTGRAFLPYGRQTVDDDDIRAVVEVLRSDWLTQGPVVERFERSLADLCEAEHAVAVSSGTAALHLAALAGRVEVVKVLLEKGADPNGRDAGGLAPLHLAAAGGDARTVSALLAAEADATAAGPGGTPLDVALAAGAFDVAELLAPPDR